MIVADSRSGRERAAQVIAAGGVLAFRTDTFYGLGADPFQPAALRVIKTLKGREATKPILIVISDASAIERFIADRSAVFDLVCARHWPGPLTVVGRARAEVPAELTAGTGTIGVRLPDDERVREFIRLCGGALTATSANLAGEPPASTARQVASSFPTGLALVLDSGAALGDRPSTVLDLSEPKPRLIREGALAKSVLAETLAGLGERLD